MATMTTTERGQFNPYTDNGGSTLAIAGEDFCVVASDTRQSEGYSINSRYSPKAYKLTESTVLATSGFHADGSVLTKNIKAQIQMYKFSHEKVMTTAAIAQMTSIMLYQRRFFPYYTFNIIGGLDDEGKGAVYSFDPVGSYEREGYRAGGSAASLIQPFLDNQIGFKNIDQSVYPKRQLTKEKAIQLAKDAFTSATERDIYTGDNLDLFVITKEGIELHNYPLKRD